MRCLCVVLWMLFSFAGLPWSATTTAWAADITLPAVSPYHTIHVQAQTVAKQSRGSYDVYAFRGECSLRQGELSATCDDLIIWVDRTPPSDPNIPRKIITTMEGNVSLYWEANKLLQDARWMGHLFSFQDIQPNVQATENRSDIPRLDWSRESTYSAVVPAQYTAPGTNAAAPPLLPAPNTQTLPAPNGNRYLPGSAVPATPGAIAWPIPMRQHEQFHCVASRRLGHSTRWRSTVSGWCRTIAERRYHRACTLHCGSGQHGWAAGCETRYAQQTHQQSLSSDQIACST